jgi:hypothetical protein
LAKTLARVELHSATEADYRRLHELMAQAGFARLIPTGDGRRFWLPSGTYYSEQYPSREPACTAASAAARSTGRTYTVTMTEGPTVFENLIEAR